MVHIYIFHAGGSALSQDQQDAIKNHNPKLSDPVLTILLTKDGELAKVTGKDIKSVVNEMQQTINLDRNAWEAVQAFLKLQTIQGTILATINEAITKNATDTSFNANVVKECKEFGFFSEEYIQSYNDANTKIKTWTKQAEQQEPQTQLFNTRILNPIKYEMIKYIRELAEEAHKEVNLTEQVKKADAFVNACEALSFLNDFEIPVKNGEKRKFEALVSEHKNTMTTDTKNFTHILKSIKSMESQIKKEMGIGGLGFKEFALIAAAALVFLALIVYYFYFSSKKDQSAELDLNEDVNEKDEENNYREREI